MMGFSSEAELRIRAHIGAKLRDGESLKAIEAWKKSEDGLRFICQAYGYNTQYCRKELMALTKISRAKNRELWTLACEKAWGWSWETKTAKLKLGTVEHLKEAERVQWELGGVPPHFKTVLQCPRCGPMFGSEHGACSCGSISSSAHPQKVLEAEGKVCS